jgi:hypothetical protein
MKPLAKADLLSYEAYERSRDSFRQRIIELKQRRRLSIGDKVTLIFENRHTVQFQIQEMIRAERIFDPDRVQGELDVYNALLPSDGELSATLFVEITDRDAIERDLDAFQGIDHGRTVAICAVHCVKFCPSPEWIREVAQEGASVSIRIEHSAYRREVTVSDEMRQEWLADLRL